MIQNRDYTLMIDKSGSMAKEDAVNCYFEHKSFRRLNKDEELAISFIQVGRDIEATRFLKALDDDLQSVGAKFDIVDTVTVEDMENMSLSEVLLNAITD